MSKADEASPVQELVINYVRSHQSASVKSAELVSAFYNLAGGNPLTTEARLSRCLAKMHKSGILNRKKVVLGWGHDGTRWVYAYDVSDL